MFRAYSASVTLHRPLFLSLSFSSPLSPRSEGTHGRGVRLARWLLIFIRFSHSTLVPNRAPSLHVNYLRLCPSKFRVIKRSKGKRLLIGLGDDTDRGQRLRTFYLETCSRSTGFSNGIATPRISYSPLPTRIDVPLHAAT